MKSIVARLTRYRWCLPVIAELWKSDGAKFVTLVRRLGSSDRAMRQALDYLMDDGWVMRNPGYGHPWRPEYILTEQGKSAGIQACEILDALGPRRADLALDRWCLVILASLSDGPRRHSELKRLAGSITPRSLTLALTKLGDRGLVSRAVSDGSPPAVIYALTGEGTAVAKKLDLLPGAWTGER